MNRAELLNQIRSAKLYGILDTGYVGADDMASAGRSLLEGGVGVLQLRAKGMSQEQVQELFDQNLSGLPELCKSFGVPLIVNDFPQVAVAVGADGVHVGQDDGSLVDARGVVGQEMIVGRSTHSVQQAQLAQEEGFDYIGFGPLFPTPTKQGRPGIGLENIRQVQETVGEEIPVFCIGGIKPDNLELVLASGARSVVIVSALLGSSDISSLTRKVVNRLG